MRYLTAALIALACVVAAFGLFYMVYGIWEFYQMMHVLGGH